MTKEGITGLILAGGRGVRMQKRDKGLVALEGKPLIQHVNERLEKQVEQMMVNANRNRASYEDLLGHVVVEDSMDSFVGPLAGILAGMRKAHDGWMAVVPCDCPFIPLDLVSRLRGACTEKSVCIAFDGKREQPLFMLVCVSLSDNLEEYLVKGGRKVDVWYRDCGYHRVDFSDQPQAFVNVNTQEDLRRLQTN